MSPLALSDSSGNVPQRERLVWNLRGALVPVLVSPLRCAFVGPPVERGVLVLTSEYRGVGGQRGQSTFLLRILLRSALTTQALVPRIRVSIPQRVTPEAQTHRCRT